MIEIRAIDPHVVDGTCIDLEGLRVYAAADFAEAVDRMGREIRRGGGAGDDGIEIVVMYCLLRSRLP